MVGALVLIVLAALVIATASLGVATALRSRTAPTSALTPDLNMDALSTPPFTLTSQDGRPVTRDTLNNGVTIVDFFFSNCPFICPTMSQNMKRAQDELAGTGVRLLSISVDPEHDTPDRLRDYARKLGADTSRWTFATGARDEVSRIMTEGLLMAPPVENTAAPIDLSDGETMPNISHPSRLILVGPGAKIIALYAGLDREQVDLLIERARAADEELRQAR